ncbi:hypothetical protein EIK77_007899 [Talaromyces pinophilus]|nr:hypothetical protein EIK77_007899 [Talaromyces pinophilus]
MSSDNHVVGKTLSLLDNVELPYPGGPLLAAFVTEALNPVHAAHYLHERLSSDEPSSIVADWSYIIQCTPDYIRQYEVKHMLMGPEEPIPLEGIYPLLGDHSRLGTEKIDPRFIGTHARLCKSIRYLELTKRFAADRLPRVSGSLIWRSISYFILPFQRLRRGIFSMTDHFTSILASIWSVFPAKLRLAGYGVLQQLGERIYGKPNGYSTVQRLPFGLYLKFLGDVEGFCNEFNALRVVRKNTSIPVPRSLDLAIKPAVLDDPFSSPEAYLLTTRLPGQPLSRCLEILSDQDLEQISYQLKDYLSQLRSIPKTINPEMAICNTVGEACHDPRIQGGQPVGPFKDEAAFSQTLRYSDEPARRGHEIVFTHADLNPRNILVDRVVQPDGSRSWKVTGIVDWETSGYYPEYWDYTKAMFEEFRGFRRYTNMVRKVFAAFGDYSREYDVEKRSWESGDGV